MIEIEYGGGLGDVFRQMYDGGSYRVLESLDGGDERAVVHLVTHNPHAGELFRWHRNADRMDVREHGYWCPSENAVRRVAAGLPVPQRGNPGCADASGPVVFYPSAEDAGCLASVTELKTKFPDPGYVVFAVSAGESDRTFPSDIAAWCLLEVLSWEVPVVLVGRDYDRHGRRELFAELPVELMGSDMVVNAINRLSVPGVCRVVQGAAGVVCAHSAVNMLAWLERIPQCLLYPKSVKARHFLEPDLWSFGAGYPECAHGVFGDSRRVMEGFGEKLKVES